jgi:hypothetical protein
MYILYIYTFKYLLLLLLSQKRFPEQESYDDFL